MPASFAGRLATLNPTRIGGDVKAPTKIKDVKPLYPPIARDSRVQGVVIVEAIIDAAGDVVEARVLRSIPLLDEAALEAVQQWRFTPTVVDGVPQAVVMTVTVNFTLQ
jgi:protein TonB